MRNLTYVLLSALFGLVSSAPMAMAAQTTITIGTAGVTGVYYSTGGAICRLVNKGRKEHGIRCSVESTPGSVYNLETIRAGELDMAIVQSDWQHHAYHGTSKFAKQGAFTTLRAVFSAHPEPFTVVARADSGIRKLHDLKGRRVNIGNPGSGQRGTMEVVMKSLGWTTGDFAFASELKSIEQSKALCDNEIDAMVFTVGHPSASIKEATAFCDSVIVEVSGPTIDELVRQNEYYRYAVIPGRMYRGTPNDVQTFGVGATFVTSSEMADEVVYQVVKSVFENFDEFRKLHPAFEVLEKQEMIKAGLSAPLHDGAARYYKDAGLM